MMGVLLGCALLSLGLMRVSRLSLATEVSSPQTLWIAQARVQLIGTNYPTAPPSDTGPDLSLPDNWDGRRPDYTGYLWYVLDVPAAPQAMPAWQRPAVYIPAAAMNAEVWLNGQRVGGAGRMHEPVSRHFYTPQLIEIPLALWQQAGPRPRLAVLLHGHPGYRCGLAPVWLGEHEDLYGAWRLRRFLQTEGNAATIVINLSMAVFVLLIGWRDRSHTAYLWFGAAATVWALRNLNYWVVNPVIPDLLFAKLCVSGAAWFVALFTVFSMRFTQAHLPDYQGPRYLLPAALSYATLATLYFLSAPDYAQANAGFVLLAAMGIGFTFWSLWRLIRLAFKHPTPHLIVVAGGAMIYWLLLLNDYAIGADRSSLGEIFVRQYAALPLFIALTSVFAKRYRDALTQARELADSLQSQVAMQREQLERSFERLREVEREQAREQERARVMGDLHDGLGLHLATALRQARTDNTSREVLLSSLQDCLDELRVAIDSLDEHERDPLSLLGSLRFRMAPRFAAMGMKLEWHIAPDLDALELPTLNPSQALHLLRLVQEMLSNAIKHSQATVVTMALSREDDHVLIRISDNGKGFNPDTIPHGRGLGHLHTRAQGLGAHITWERPPQGFTWVLCLNNL